MITGLHTNYDGRLYFQFVCGSQVLSRGGRGYRYYPSLWSQVLSGGRGYPSLWSQVLSQRKKEVMRQGTPYPPARYRTGVPSPSYLLPDSTCHGQDTLRTVYLLWSRRRTLLFIKVNKYLIFWMISCSGKCILSQKTLRAVFWTSILRVSGQLVHQVIKLAFTKCVGFHTATWTTPVSVPTLKH